MWVLDSRDMEKKKEELKWSAWTQASAWVCFWWMDVRMKDAHHSVGHGVTVHPHLRVHVDQVPSEGFTLQPLPQRLPVWHITDINTRVLVHTHTRTHTHTHTQKEICLINHGLWRSTTDNGNLKNTVQPFVVDLRGWSSDFSYFATALHSEIMG